MKKRNKVAFITGITGQDGSYLAEFLLDKNYTVYGLLRRKSKPDYGNVSHIRNQINFIFGETKISPQDENSPISPANPYAAAKALAHFDARIYRKSFNLFISTGILFNHESPRRSPDFVTRKVSLAVASIKLGLKSHQVPLGQGGESVVNAAGKLELGNLDSVRDWGFAGDYVESMWKILQHKDPDDFIIATGKGHTIKDLCQTAFDYVGLNWKDYVVTNPK